MSGAIPFIPRSLVAKKKETSSAPGSSKLQSENKKAVSSAYKNDVDDEVVKATSAQQRWANAEEPVCIMCGKYGEYICDETDEDVCSLKCKADHITSVRKQSTTLASTSGNKIFKNNPNDKNSGDDASIAQVQDFATHFAGCLRRIRESTNFERYDEEKCSFFRQKLAIQTKGVSTPSLVLGFNECGFSDQLMSNLQENDYFTPTPVQMQTIPIGLNYRDALVSATTSSGKTASFLLPIAHIISQFLAQLPVTHEFRKLPLALIMAPTRELCMQIEEQMKAFCKSLENIKTCLLVGGNPLPQQLYRLRHKIQIIIGTPGRINDVIDNHGDALPLRHIKMVVLDEVDLMLQMGFLNQIERVLHDVPPNPQYMMFSATIPKPIEHLAEKRMNNPVFVSIGQSGVTNSLVHQVVMWVEEVSKRKKLFSVICEPKHFRPPMLVFVESKIGADMLCEAIQEKLGITCESIHSDKSQGERNIILKNFLTGSYKVLVSTNVMGRGLDLPNVKQVIIFDMPKTIEDYVHQVGRAGRLKTEGVVMVFINKSNKNLFLPLQELCRKSGAKLPDELVNSRYLHDALDKQKKTEAEKTKALKRKKWDEQELNQKTLLEILTKQRRK